MSISTHSKTLEQTIAAIQALDLTMIKFKATRREDGHGWSAEYAEQMAVAYKRYLILHAKYPSMTLAPEQDVDRFWHLHILDTRKYADDCDACFGYFVHHFPYLGLRGGDDEKVAAAAFEAMQALYVKEFGETMAEASAREAAAWCAIAPPPEAKAAWCAIAPPPEAKAAWCAIAPPPEAKAAWCAIAPPPEAKAAWCAIAPPPEARAAWCAIAPPSRAIAA